MGLGIEPEAGGLGEGEPAPNEGRNGFGKTGYDGPSPPPGHGTHRYFFRVHALDMEPKLKPAASREELEAAIDGHVLASAPARFASVRTDQGWRIDGFNFGSGPGALVSHAYCDKPRPSIRTKTAEVEVQPGESESATASCGGKRRAIAGGFSTEAFDNLNGPRVIAIASHRVGKRKWAVEGLNVPAESPPQTDSPGVLTAYVYCQRSRRLVTRMAEEVVAGGTGSRSR